ncbi:D-glycero-beta-D-manno-heptose 1-phosphate adenylyltransferase [Thermocrinis sp.]|uniref:D-glycero-beta-D-manno-heptose 1-phosphate adenylyltransferase n=1 Tax=Thermocrinis sp. TaxID=2024383 RepID=UPI002FDE74BD
MIIELNELLGVLEDLRGRKRIVFTNGCFDILHAGHADYLKKAKSLGDVLVVGINSDESIKRIKGEKRPIIPQHLRAFLLDSLKPVDYVVIFEEDTPLELIKAIKPDILVKGADWDLDKIVGADFVLSYGGKVERIEFSFDISTTKIIEKILNLNCF